MIALPKAPGRDLPVLRFGGDDDRHTLLPLLWVEVAFAAKQIGVPALIDSGATWTVVPAWIAEEAGIDWDALPPGGTREWEGAGRGFYGNQLRIRACPGRVLFGGRAIPMPDLQVLAPGDLANPFVILGRWDFMRVFRVTFDLWRDPPTFSVEVPHG